MSNTTASLQHKISNAGELQAVVRTMKALAAASISQYEQSVIALGDYYRAVELGLGACFRDSLPELPVTPGSSRPDRRVTGAIVFGSDQGLVGQFNEEIAEFAVKTLKALPGACQLWVVGERVHGCLENAGLPLQKCYNVPTGINGIAPLVGQLQIDSEAGFANNDSADFYVFHNSPGPGASCQPGCKRLLPLDRQWQQALARAPWPTNILPEILCSDSVTMRALIREYLFISLYRASAESLASENASRLAAMQRAEKNIDEQLEKLALDYHRLRQNSIDEELFDVVAGYELSLASALPVVHEPKR